ncbi:MAG: hypothetical protein JWP83_2722 [Mycobacterium sp.]|jgi:hypothetical protein|nr:hypothetical protein [Mycobacterium sp.]
MRAWVADEDVNGAEKAESDGKARIVAYAWLCPYPSVMRTACLSTRPFQN